MCESSEMFIHPETCQEVVEDMADIYIYIPWIWHPRSLFLQYNSIEWIYEYFHMKRDKSSLIIPCTE